MRIIWTVIAIALIFTVAGSVGVAQQYAESDARPARAVTSSTSVPVGTGTDFTSVINDLEAQLQRLPDDHRGWALLSLAYVEQARLTGNTGYYASAGRAIRRSFEIQPTRNFSALSASAALAGARHQFRSALRQSQAALAINSHDTTALAIRVDALTELGRYPAQLQALREADRRQPGVPIAVRYAYAVELRGQIGRAASILRQSSRVALSADRGFLLTLLADVQRRRGNLDAAESALNAAARAKPGYLEALVSRARLDLARGDLASGLRRWERAVDRAPDVDHLVELAELYLHLGRERDARTALDRAAATLEELRASGQNVDHDLTVFAADHGSAVEAVRAARAEWQRRQSIHTADALAWALHQTGRDEPALRLAQRATRLGTPEALLWLHRGAIEAALGRTADAERHLAYGLTLDPGISPWQIDRAELLLARIG